MDVDQSSDRVNDARDNRIWDNQIKMRGKKQWPKLSLKYSILLCYLGCLKIQQPVFLSDIRRWCVSLKLPYLKVLQSAGLDFMHRLGGWDGNMVPFCAVPKMSSLYEDACTLILRYREDAGIVFPPNNPVIVAQRLCSQFLLPTELVPCVLKVRRLMYDAYSKDSFIHAAIAYIEETAMLICILWVAHMCFSLKEPSLVHGRVSWLRMAEMNLHQRRKAAETDELGSEDVSLDMLTSYLTSASLVKSERGGALQLLGEDEYLAGLDAKANPRPNYMPIPSSMAKKTTSVDLQRLIAGCDTELELRPGNTSQSQAHRIMTELAADISLVDPEMVAIELRHLQRLLIKEYGED
ncbi:hypothetical protein BCR43DRAFT_207155 [Syncephalastrum racemosum]|uniref:Uncharacterized protein n=1 Tax=Syncephalastrum racemosum TaxID=13706 RepID=A0A1X2HI67_SYNRA|nr:hypothetical protein BCR43DRAFT_207155 [Syncephalastrum racemosum]